MDNMFKCTLYSLKPLPTEVRSIFRLPAYPFVEGHVGPLPEETRQFFEDLSIVSYRDSVSPFGIVIQPADEDPTPIKERSGYLGYMSIAMLGWKGMQIVQWERDGNPVKYDKIVKKHGDAYAWMIWNRPGTIMALDEKRVKVV